MRTPSREAINLPSRFRRSHARQMCWALLPFWLLGCGTAPEPAAPPTADIVTVPAWVGLIGAPDAGRRGAYDETSVGDGEIAVSFGHTTGFAAPLTGGSVPSIDAEDRRTANLRTAPKEIAGSTVSLSAGVRETRETFIATADPAAQPGQRSSAGAGGTVQLLDGRISVDGEVAGAQSEGQSAADDNFARRLRLSALVLESGGAAWTANASMQSAGTGYSIPGGIAPDWAQQGVGTKLTAGPISVSLDAEERRNNLLDDVTILTARERTLRPSLAISLDRLRPGATSDGGFQPGRLLPSMVRFSHGETWHTETASAGSAINPADSSSYWRRSDSLALDWGWNRAMTTLTLGADRSEALTAWNAADDGTGRAVSLSHSLRGTRIATTLSASARRSEGIGAIDDGRTDGYDISAAFTGRDGPLGDLIAAFSVHQDRTQPSSNSTVLLVDTTWQAKLAFDLTRVDPGDLRDGALKFAVALKGGDPVTVESPFGTELVLGLSSQFGF